MSAIGRYVIQAGDTIHRIALRQLGSADQWWVLVRMNRLVYPYLDTSAASRHPGVLGVGDTLLIPGNAADPAIRRVSGSEDGAGVQYDVLLGTDIDLAFGELAPSSVGDVRTVAGLQNLVGALERRLGTRKGELPYHPTYGSHLEQHIGRPHDAARQILIKNEVVQTCLADPRITSVSRVQVADDQDHVAIRCVCTVIGHNDEVPLNLVIQRKAVA